MIMLIHVISLHTPICSMVLVYLPTFAQHQSPSYGAVNNGKYTIQGGAP